MVHLSLHPEAGAPPKARRTRLAPTWLIGAVTAAVALALCPVPATAATAQPASADVTDRSSGLPPGIPAATTAPEPTLPRAEGWAFSEQFPRTSGTGRYDAGAFLWTDWLYDDMGRGDFTYASPDAGANGADVFRAAIAGDATHTYWRVDWNTLIDPAVPVATWAFDTDADTATGTASWPADAGVASPGVDTAMIVSSRGAWLVDAETGARTDLTASGATVTVDEAARSFVVAVPRTVMPADDTWTVRLAAGVANAAGDGFAPAPQAADGSRVYNAGFRDRDDEAFLTGGWTDSSTRWNNGAQSAALTAGDVSDFSAELDWGRIAQQASTAEPAPTGYSTRWYVSSLDLGQGLDPQARLTYGPALRGPSFFGRVQPYTVYVPTGYDAGDPAPLTLLLHAGDRNHNGFGGTTQEDVYGPMCEERGSICVTPLGRGNTTWYINEGELDVWEVWGDLARTYTLDPDRTVIGGWSMGAVGATRIATNHPDLFAATVIVSGAGYYDTQGRRDQAGDESRMENLRNLVTFMDSGSRDVALNNTRRWDAAADAADVRYRANYYENADHGQLGQWLGWSDAAEYVEQHPEREHSPAQVSFRWEPGDEQPDLGITVDRAYWLTGLAVRDTSARWSRVEATSHALATTSTEAVLTDQMQVIDGRNVQVRDQAWVPTGEQEPRNALDLTTENVAKLRVELDRAGIDAAAPAEVNVTADGEVTIQLTRDGATRVAHVPTGTHRLSSPQAPADVTAVAVGRGVRVTWTTAASDLPLDGYIVRDASGEVVCETRATTCRITGDRDDEPQEYTVTAVSILGPSEPAPASWAAVRP